MKKVAKKSSTSKPRTFKDRKLKSYRVIHEIEIYVSFCEGDILLYGFKSSNSKEEKLLGDVGEYSCWNAVASITDEEWIFTGDGAPITFHTRGISRPEVRITIPKNLITRIHIE